MNKRIIIILLIILCAAALIQSFRYFHINIDDKFVLYKYAVNFINGHGLVYDHNDRVEGFSSFLDVMLMSLLFRIFHLTDATVLTASMMSLTGKIVSIIFLMLTLIFLFKLLYQVFNLNIPVTGISLFLLVLRRDFIFHASNGLETALFIFLYTLFIFYMFRSSPEANQNDKPGFKILASLFASLAVLARTDGFIFVGAFGLFFFFVNFYQFKKHGKAINHLLRNFIFIATPVLTTFLAYLVFRIFYFQDILPSTFYVKVSGLSEKIYAICSWFLDSQFIFAWQRYALVLSRYVLFAMGLPLLFFSLFTAIMFFKKRLAKLSIPASYFQHYEEQKNGNSGLSAYVYILFFSTLICCLYVIYVGGDWMPGFRYVMHFFPAAYVVSTALMLNLLSILIQNKEIVRVTYVSLFLFASLNLFSFDSINKHLSHESSILYSNGHDYYLPEEHSFYFFNKDANFTHSMVNYSDFVSHLKGLVTPHGTVAFYEAGGFAILFDYSVDIIDLGGLNNKVMGKSKGEEGYYSMCHGFLYQNQGESHRPRDQYLINSSPEYIVFDKGFIFYESLPHSILGDRYEYVSDFPCNNLGMFAVYKKKAMDNLSMAF